MNLFELITKLVLSLRVLNFKTYTLLHTIELSITHSLKIVSGSTDFDSLIGELIYLLKVPKLRGILNRLIHAIIVPAALHLAEQSQGPREKTPTWRLT